MHTHRKLRHTLSMREQVVVIWLPTFKLMRRLEYKILYRVKLRLYGIATMNGPRGVHKYKIYVQ